MNQYYKAVSEAKKANLIAHPLAGGYQGTGTLFLKEVELPTEEEVIEGLAKIYVQDSKSALCVATVCDEALDKSGSLLGKVREKAIIKKMEK